MYWYFISFVLIWEKFECMGSEGIMYASVKLEVIDGRAQQGVEHAA